MKALAIDSSSMKMTVAAKNDDKTVTLSLDIGMRQSEKILPSIDYVLQQAEITPADLDYTVLCMGPGSFTGLRLGFAALKAIEMAYTVPVYGISTLEAYAYPYKKFLCTVISVIDAKKDRFYASVYRKGIQLLKDGDYTPDEILTTVEKDSPILVCGPDAKIFCTAAVSSDRKFLSVSSQPPVTDSLFSEAEIFISEKKPALKDFDGPAYLRASEAEEALTK